MNPRSELAYYAWFTINNVIKASMGQTEHRVGEKRNSDHHGDVRKRAMNAGRDVIITFLFIIFIMTVIMWRLWLNSILLVRFVVSRNNYHLSDIKIHGEHFHSQSLHVWQMGFLFIKERRNYRWWEPLTFVCFFVEVGGGTLSNAIFS